jgi:NAD(P)-dependent dehydrogenase (short-subunit alcohol dehydrogenase family)
MSRRRSSAYGPKIHIVYNNPGVMTDNEMNQVFSRRSRPLREDALDDWQWTFEVNFWGVVYGIHTFVPLMLPHGEEGHIVNTAS